MTIKSNTPRFSSGGSALRMFLATNSLVQRAWCHQSTGESSASVANKFHDMYYFKSIWIFLRVIQLLLVLFCFWLCCSKRTI